MRLLDRSCSSWRERMKDECQRLTVSHCLPAALTCRCHQTSLSCSITRRSLCSSLFCPSRASARSRCRVSAARHRSSRLASSSCSLCTCGMEWGQSIEWCVSCCSSVPNTDLVPEGLHLLPILPLLSCPAFLYIRLKHSPLLPDTHRERERAMLQSCDLSHGAGSPELPGLLSPVLLKLLCLLLLLPLELGYLPPQELQTLRCHREPTVVPGNHRPLAPLTCSFSLPCFSSLAFMALNRSISVSSWLSLSLSSGSLG